MQRMGGAIGVFNAQERPVTVTSVETKEQLDRVPGDLTEQEQAVRGAGRFPAALAEHPGGPRRPRDCSRSPSMWRSMGSTGSRSTTFWVAGWPPTICSIWDIVEIAFLGDSVDQPMGFTSSQRREDGFRAAMAARSVQVDEASGAPG